MRTRAQVKVCWLMVLLVLPGPAGCHRTDPNNPAAAATTSSGLPKLPHIEVYGSSRPSAGLLGAGERPPKLGHFEELPAHQPRVSTPWLPWGSRSLQPGGPWSEHHAGRPQG